MRVRYLSALFFLDFLEEALDNKKRIIWRKARCNMKKRQGILIGVIAAIVLVMTGIAFGIFGSGEQKQDSAIRKYKGLEKIEYIKYSNGEEEDVLIKKDGAWIWKEDPELKVDQEYVAAQVSSISNYLKIEKLEEKGKLKSFGLKDSEISMTLKDSRGRKITIFLGDMYTEDSYYAQIGNSNNIYVVSGEVMSVIDNLVAQKVVAQEPDRETYTMEEVE